ncbi:MAG: LLM class F420-dependent oxidoreductase [Gammaproteobacteria bacterium]|nr:MAG: LLM class F420-dependent oxidoreductase [Gammaproteobacteria bacterium]
MKIGVMTARSDFEINPAVVAKRAEELGFESYWVADHTVIPVHSTCTYPGVAPGTPQPDYLWGMPDPLMALMTAAAVTSTINLGTGVLLVPERNPLLTANMVATLDDASRGRYLMGIGAGWNREECEMLGGNFDRRWGQVKDYILAMKQLWTQDESEYHGEFIDFPPVKCYPKPHRKPHPPILFGGEGSRKIVFKRIAEWGDGWMPLVKDLKEFAEGLENLKRACDDVGRDYDEISRTAFGLPGQWREPEEVRALEAAGADRVVLWLPAEGSIDVVLKEMESIASDLL